jgi:hypothetical protein
MPFKRSTLRAADLPVVVVETPPLGQAEQRFVMDALWDVAQDWTVDLHGFCTDEATLIMVPEDGDDEFGPSFVVSREAFGYRVDQVHWDEAQEIGLFSALSDATTAIRARLTGDDAMTRSVPVRLH